MPSWPDKGSELFKSVNLALLRWCSSSRPRSPPQRKANTLLESNLREAGFIYSLWKASPCCRGFQWLLSDLNCEFERQSHCANSNMHSRRVFESIKKYCPFYGNGSANAASLLAVFIDQGKWNFIPRAEFILRLFSRRLWETEIWAIKLQSIKWQPLSGFDCTRCL